MSEVVVFHYFDRNDALARDAINLIEGRTIEIDKRYSVRIDPPHHSKMQKHYHVLHKGDQVCVINQDGTPSHGSSPDDLPGYILQHVRDEILGEDFIAHSERLNFAKIIAYAEKRHKSYSLLQRIFAIMQEHRRLKNQR